MQPPVATNAQQLKVLPTAHKVRTLAHAKHMVYLHITLGKTTATHSTAAILAAIKHATVTNQAVTDVPTAIIMPPTTLQAVRSDIYPNPVNLSFL